MRRAAHVDANQGEVVTELRRAGIKVLSLAAMGKGCPDLLCAFRGVNVLLEVKNPARSHHPGEHEAWVAFAGAWPGPAYRVASPSEAVAAVVEAARATVEARELLRSIRAMVAAGVPIVVGEDRLARLIELLDAAGVIDAQRAGLAP